MIFVLGIDAATWTVVKPNLSELPALDYLCHKGEIKTLVIKEKPISPAIWCGMFCGLPLTKHGHDAYVANETIIKRENIKVDFIWDVLAKSGKKAVALNVPFIVPPYSYGAQYRPVGFGLPTNDKEWYEELERLTAKTKEIMALRPDLLVSVFTLLDRVQHFHWGEPCVLDWYKRLDAKLSELLIDTGFVDNPDNKLIVISDHGFCSFGEAKVQTLPKKTGAGELKGDHHENALLITVNIDYEIDRPQDVFYAVKKMS
jgi:predicted AlkP superfamily phosphohydrolase/phosphomutase